MNFYVNLYRLPESQRKQGQDNIICGQLCRSLEEARDEAIANHLLHEIDVRKAYVGTLRDAEATKAISAWIDLASEALMRLVEQGHAWPRDIKSFLEYWDTSVQEHQKRKAV